MIIKTPLEIKIIPMIFGNEYLSLKNKLTNSKEENEIIIDLQTVKTKNIKDKNINNQITKYEITVVSTIKVNFINKNISEIIQISSSGNYDVVSSQTKTINNQRGKIVLLFPIPNCFKFFLSSSLCIYFK